MTKQESNDKEKLNMKTTHSEMIETVKDKIVAAIKGTGNIVQATMDTVTQILATTIKDTGKVGTSVTDVIANVASGAIRGAVQVGADLGHAAKGIMLGVLRGTKARGHRSPGYHQPHRPGCGPRHGRGRRRRWGRCHWAGRRGDRRRQRIGSQCRERRGGGCRRALKRLAKWGPRRLTQFARQ